MPNVSLRGDLVNLVVIAFTDCNNHDKNFHVDYFVDQPACTSLFQHLPKT
ncbi:hypothetical protein [Phyllobacterium leguminum]|uniref:Uncharacterized protein n=1 Tax=Phyllobacterium leguminum TaxID=314237 RepID=A0A318T3S3_9HYPH|nr:hypothetical protein [Phyllobacterium leguminum]PYE88743.1 hypothetical protein C7477_106115 [Phyllobacterium leguminum]